ncbi:MAG: hypothetical protein HRU76_02865 [Phycisphaeraceae bacterium]|nr:MAG: hypothetical protein HRU76_02865 [Phycisphaeraceae bacterium]
MSFVRLGAALVAAAAVGASASAGTVFSQPGGTSGGQGIGYYSSLNGLHLGGTSKQRIGDDFSLASATSVAAMTFWGWSDDEHDSFSFGNRHATQNILSFNIEIFKLNGAGSTPGDSLLDETFAIGDVSIQADGNVWRYSVTFTNAVALDANTMYGISVSANLNSPTGPWGFVWENAAAANNQVFANFGFGWQSFNTVTRDNMAFALFDEPPIVPLPAPVFLALAGLAGALPMRKKLLGCFRA